MIFYLVILYGEHGCSSRLRDDVVRLKVVCRPAHVAYYMRNWQGKQPQQVYILRAYLSILHAHMRVLSSKGWSCSKRSCVRCVCRSMGDSDWE